MYTVDECWKFDAMNAEMLGGYYYYLFEYALGLFKLWCDFLLSSLFLLILFHSPLCKLCVHCARMFLCVESNKYGTIIDIRSNPSRWIKWSLNAVKMWSTWKDVDANIQRPKKADHLLFIYRLCCCCFIIIIFLLFVPQHTR